MKYTVAALLSLSSLVTALPTTQNPPQGIRILPPAWGFTITSLKGPGCPDFGADPEVQRATRTTFGRNTVDGSEIYYWFVAYPYLRVELGLNDHSWCETELKYTEYKDVKGEEEGEDYLFRLHKNGTSVIATYDLEEGMTAKFDFTYDVGEGVCSTGSSFYTDRTASGQGSKVLACVLLLMMLRCAQSLPHFFSCQLID